MTNEEGTYFDEDHHILQMALHCTETSNAGHWPTVANILADEVYRLRKFEDAVNAVFDYLSITDSYGDEVDPYDLRLTIKTAIDD